MHTETKPTPNDPSTWTDAEHDIRSLLLAARRGEQKAVERLALTARRMPARVRRALTPECREAFEQAVALEVAA